VRGEGGEGGERGERGERGEGERGERGERGGSGSSGATDVVGGPQYTSQQILALQHWVLRAEGNARVEAVRADRLETVATQLASQLQHSEAQFVSAVQLALATE